MPIWKARPRPEDADTAATADDAGSDAALTDQPAVVEPVEAVTAETATAETATAVAASAATPIDEKADPFVPDPSFTGVAASPEAYAAARAALAAKLIGARYGDSADDYLEHVRLAVHAMNDDVAASEKAVQVVPATRTTILVPLPQPAAVPMTPVVAPLPQPVVQPVVRAVDEKPGRRRRPVAFILAGGLLVVLAAGIAGYGMLAPKPTPTADPTTGPTGTPLPLVVVGTHATPSPSASPTPTPTKAPTKAPTKKPVVTRKPTPVPFYARWSPNPPKYPAWRVQTWAGASCTLTRIWIAPAPATNTTRTYTMTVNAGIATYTSGTWAAGRTYHVYATCTLSGKTASTTTYTLKT